MISQYSLFIKKNEEFIVQHEMSGLTDISLRLVSHKDCQAIWDILQNPLVQEFNDYPLTITKGDVRDLIQGDIERAYKLEGSRFVIVFNLTGQVVGSIGLFNINKAAQSAYVGFELAPEFFGKGIMHKAVSILLSKTVKHHAYQINTVYADVKPGNAACIALLKKLGFTFNNKIWEKLL
ncbi:MAG: GNAT family N-acetyltransferase [Pseudoalteromonas sp.]|uniref:GNAT family N-acetyltransferase n=1 Tax=unclassified Pseudoalteromonas TaxID=194690 RepID=UPI003F9827AB